MSQNPTPGSLDTNKTIKKIPSPIKKYFKENPQTTKKVNLKERPVMPLPSVIDFFKQGELREKIKEEFLDNFNFFRMCYNLQKNRKNITNNETLLKYIIIHCAEEFFPRMDQALEENKITNDDFDYFIDSIKYTQKQYKYQFSDSQLAFIKEIFTDPSKRIIPDDVRVFLNTNKVNKEMYAEIERQYIQNIYGKSKRKQNKKSKRNQNKKSKRKLRLNKKSKKMNKFKK